MRQVRGKARRFPSFAWRREEAEPASSDAPSRAASPRSPLPHAYLKKSAGTDHCLVGYKIRFQDRTARTTRIKFMTDGILLAEAQRDRNFRSYDTIIVDEAHERTLNIDFLIGILKQTLSKRPDLKVIITSATIDPQKFSSAFGGAPYHRSFRKDLAG